MWEKDAKLRPHNNEFGIIQQPFIQNNTLLSLEDDRLPRSWRNKITMPRTAQRKQIDGLESEGDRERPTLYKGGKHPTLYNAMIHKLGENGVQGFYTQTGENH